MIGDKKYICIKTFEIIGSWIKKYDIFNIVKETVDTYKVLDFITPICKINKETFDECFREATEKEIKLDYELRNKFREMKEIMFQNINC